MALRAVGARSARAAMTSGGIDPETDSTRTPASSTVDDHGPVTLRGGVACAHVAPTSASPETTAWTASRPEKPAPAAELCRWAFRRVGRYPVVLPQWA